MKKTFFILCTTLTLAGCQAPAPRIIYSEEDRLEAGHRYKSCVIVAIKQTDDGKSDAYTIANAAATLCSKEYARIIEMQTADDNAWVQAKVMNDMMARKGEHLIPMVLKMRTGK